VRVRDRECGFEGLVVRRRVVRGEGDVVLGMKVFGRDSEGKRIGEELVDGRYNVASTRYREGSVLRLLIRTPSCATWATHRRTEVFLYVNNDERWFEGHVCGISQGVREMLLVGEAVW
jgi:hypothetical protein